MKKTIFTTTIIMVVALTGISSCTSSEQKVENAEARVAEAKQNLTNEIKDSVTAVANAATADEWKMFKNDADATIKNNEIKIGNLKMKIKKLNTPRDIVYVNRINALEEQNQSLKNKINAYDNNHSDWQTFKNDFSHDMQGLGKAFKDLTVPNQK